MVVSISCMSCGFVASSNSVSSAYILVRQFSSTLGSSFTYNVNSSGPRMLPCGTPTVTGSEPERQPSIITYSASSSHPVFFFGDMTDINGDYTLRGYCHAGMISTAPRWGYENTLTFDFTQQHSQA